MSSGYVKIFGSLVGSSVWCESSTTRVVWLTMLALSDERGNVYESAPAIARLARVSRQQADNALIALMGKSYDGPAITPIDGGFRVNPLPCIKIRKGRGRLSVHVRRAIWARDKGRCVQCGATEQIEYDHIVAVAHGGEDTEDNLQLLCRPCNQAKGPKAYHDTRRQA